MTLDELEERLRYLAGKFTGTEMGHHLDPTYKGSARALGVTFVNDRGEDIDVGEELLELAGEVSMIRIPIGRK